MKAVKRALCYAGAVLLIAVVHYWATLTAACVLQATATVLAKMERGYYAMGSEVLVFPLVCLIGYKITPQAYVMITEKGIRYRVRKRKKGRK